MSDRAVFIGGFGNGETLSEGVADALCDYFSDVEHMTFSQAMSERNKALLRRTAYDATVFTHSAGAMALGGLSPKEVHAFNGPLPTSRAHLAYAALKKTVNMLLDRTAEPHQVMWNLSSSTAELVAHPIRNLRPLINGDISCYNTLQHLSAWSPANRVTAVFTDEDVFFRPEKKDIEAAQRHGVRVIDGIPGVHDALTLNPSVFLKNYLETYA